MINEFKKIAPAIVESVKARMANEMTDEEVMVVIREEIVSYFDKQHQMMVEYLTFNREKRINFAEIMYEMLAPLATSFKGGINEKYAEFTRETGKTGALNYLTR